MSQNPSYASVMTAVAGLAALVVAVACQDSQSPSVDNPLDTPSTVLSAVIVSEPLGSASLIGVSARDNGSAVQLVYVSLPSGSVPDGWLAEIHNQATDGSARVAVANGGFDPVAIAADTGHTLRIDVKRVGGADSTFFLAVPKRRPPVIVRSNPPPGRNDVPLNAVMTVVFSEPIRANTLSAITLSNAGTTVPATVQLSADGLRATIQTGQGLAPLAPYIISVGTGIADLGGDTLEAPVQIPFTSGTSIIEASVYTDPAAMYVVSGHTRESLNGLLRSFEFGAVRYPGGAVTGSYRLHYQANGWGNAGRITCFTIKADTAWIAGLIESSQSNPETIGMEIGWFLVDGAVAGAPDQLSLAYVGLGVGGFGSARDFCDFQPTMASTGPEAGQVIHHQPLANGAIAMNGVSPPSARGAVRVTIQTTGAPNPDDYEVSACAGVTGCRSGSVPPGANDVIFERLPVGTQLIELIAGWETCLVAGGTAQSVAVLAADTVDVVFDVACEQVELLVPYRAAGYRYRILPDSMMPSGGFERPTFNDTAAGFATGSAAFSHGDDYEGEGCRYGGTRRTTWPVNTDLLLRRWFDVPPGLGQVTVRLAIDDDAQVFVNGVDVTAAAVPDQLQGGFQRHAGCAERDYFIVSVPDSVIRTGANLLAVRARDGGVYSYADIRVTAVR